MDRIPRCYTVRDMERITVFPVEMLVDNTAFFLSWINYDLGKISEVSENELENLLKYATVIFVGFPAPELEIFTVFNYSSGTDIFNQVRHFLPDSSEGKEKNGPQ